MTQETWKSININEGLFEGFYEVSNLGRVKSLTRTLSNGKRRKGKILSLSDNGRGYAIVKLSRDGVRKTLRVHRIVAEAFIPHIEGCNVVNHLDEDKSNNTVENLEWTTHRENLNYSLNKRAASKYAGVRPSGKKWSAICGHDGTYTYLGTHETEVEAHQAYLDYRKEHNLK